MASIQKLEDGYMEIGFFDSELERDFGEDIGRMIEIFSQKNHDYKPSNLAEFAEKGVVVLMNNKMSRLKNLIWWGAERKVKDETIEDSLLDLANYCINCYLMIRGSWPGTPQYKQRF